MVPLIHKIIWSIVILRYNYRFRRNAVSRERHRMLGGNDTHLVSVLAEERLYVWNFSYHGSAAP